MRCQALMGHWVGGQQRRLLPGAAGVWLLHLWPWLLRPWLWLLPTLCLPLWLSALPLLLLPLVFLLHLLHPQTLLLHPQPQLLLPRLHLPRHAPAHKQRVVQWPSASWCPCPASPAAGHCHQPVWTLTQPHPGLPVPPHH